MNLEIIKIKFYKIYYKFNKEKIDGTVIEKILVRKEDKKPGTLKLFFKALLSKNTSIKSWYYSWRYGRILNDFFNNKEKINESFARLLKINNEMKLNEFRTETSKDGIKKYFDLVIYQKEQEQLELAKIKQILNKGK